MAKKLIDQRKALGLSQSELADRLGISRPTLIKIEKGLRPLDAREQERIQHVFDSLSEHTNEDTVRISVPEKNIDKFRAVLLYILDRVGAKPNVGLTVLYKLLYFIDFDYYEKYEEQLMGLTYIKNTHGPTPREFIAVVEDMKEASDIVEVKSRYFQHEQKKFLPRAQADLSLLNGQELDLIDDVLRRYSDKSATTLSEMTHRDTPWKSTADGENIDYEFAFYRSEEFSVREYGEL